jgi:hypothetical protein
MNAFKSFLILICCAVSFQLITAQENTTAPVRTPEQEAAFNTEKMQKELNLSREQAQAVYEINLRHARERKVATSRSQALERVRLKDTQIQQVLTREQYNTLQEKRYDRNPNIVPPGSNTFRTSSELRDQNRIQQERSSTASQSVPQDRRIAVPPTSFQDRRATIQQDRNSSAPQSSPQDRRTVTESSPQERRAVPQPSYNRESQPRSSTQQSAPTTTPSQPSRSSSSGSSPRR